MIKLIGFLKKRSDIDIVEFRRYYESHHRHLISVLVDHIKDYRRSYPVTSPLNNSEHDLDYESGPPAFDCMTEVWFKNMDELNLALGKISDSRALFEEDEGKFIDRSLTKVVVCEELNICEELGRFENS